jgi:hypothetical protein
MRTTGMNAKVFSELRRSATDGVSRWFQGTGVLGEKEKYPVR